MAYCGAGWKGEIEILWRGLKRRNWCTVVQVEKAELTYCGAGWKGGISALWRGMKRQNSFTVVRVEKAKFVYSVEVEPYCALSRVFPSRTAEKKEQTKNTLFWGYFSRDFSLSKTNSYVLIFQKMIYFLFLSLPQGIARVRNWWGKRRRKFGSKKGRITVKKKEGR